MSQTTSPEPSFLKEIREYTHQKTSFASMLISPVEGQFLACLLKLMNAKKCLEIGTFTGYSALWLATGLPQTGTLWTCESRAHYAELAQQHFDASPYKNQIVLLPGNALRTLSLLSETFDFIFLDADKIHYPRYYDMLLPKLRPGGLLVVDNALWKTEVWEQRGAAASGIHELNQKAAADPHVETVMLTVRDGILLIRKHADHK